MSATTAEGNEFVPRLSLPADPRLSRSLEYGVAILGCFTAERPVWRGADIASVVGISRSTTHRYLMTFVELGYLEQDNKRRYRLADRAAGAGAALVNTVRREVHARGVLEDLRNVTGHTVSMGLLDGARVLYLHRFRGHRAGQYEADGNLGVGAHVPAHNTAVGMALLSCLIESELRSLLPAMSLEGGQAAQTSLAEQIERVRRGGMAVSDENDASGAWSIAAPLARFLDKPILAVALTAPASAYTSGELFACFGEPVRHAARLLSA